MSSKVKGTFTASCMAFGILLLLNAMPTTPGLFHALEDALRNYSEAVLKCRSLGHDGLAVVDSKDKLQTVLNTTKHKTIQQYWIGMHYSDKKKYHVWDTGADVTWADWNTGEPDNMIMDKCVRIRVSLNYGTWSCSEKYMAVCGNYSSISHNMTISDRQQVTFTDPLWSGKSDSLLSCVTRCTKDPRCQHSHYNSSDLTCLTLSKSYDAAGSARKTLYGSLVSKDDVTLV